MLYKVVKISEDGATLALGKSVGGRRGVTDGQFYFVPVNSERVCKFTFQDALGWQTHLDEYRRYQDGCVRKRVKGTIQIVPFREYESFGQNSFSSVEI